MHAGKRVWRQSKAEIRGLAQVVADKLGQPVTVKPGPARGQVRRMKANPDPMNLVHMLQEIEKGKAARREYVARTKGTRLAKSLGRRGGVLAEISARKTAKFQVEATNRRDRFTLFRPSRRAADRLAAEFEAAGYNVNVKEV